MGEEEAGPPQTETEQGQDRGEEEHGGGHHQGHPARKKHLTTILPEQWVGYLGSDSEYSNRVFCAGFVSSEYKNAAVKCQFQIKCAFVHGNRSRLSCTSNYLCCPVRTIVGRTSLVVTKEGDLVTKEGQGDGHTGDEEENLDSEQEVEKFPGKTHRPRL